jgi:pimeloyl-ACP methyl ester carboxylesterase
VLTSNDPRAREIDGLEEAPLSVRSPARERPFGFFFGRAERQLFGFFHAALPALESDVVAVLCKPVGWEAIASNGAYRELAERLAAGGVPTLRFDYIGTGDSSGTDEDEDRVAGWLESVQLAITEAQQLSGKSEVALIGIHFGATLAMLGALQFGGVSTLIMWAPYLTGRAYAREAKAYRALNYLNDGKPKAEDTGGVEAAGFLLSASTLAELSNLNLRSEKRKPATSILIMSRDAGGTEQPLVDHLSALGANVAHSSTTGYADLMQDPRKSVMPVSELSTIVAFIERSHARLPRPPRPRPALLGSRDRAPKAQCVARDGDGKRIIERILALGPDERFFGFLTQREDDPESVKRPLVILLNTAPHTRIGPNRMYVPMARELAQKGFATLRFDLNGVGDTPRIPGGERNPIYSKAFVKDVRAAIDALAELGFERFVAVGLCSGAYLAFHSALAEPRLEGVVLVNAQTFDWKDGDSLEVKRRVSVMSNSFYKRAILQKETWKRAVTGKIDLRTIGQAVLGRAKHRAQVEVRRALTSVGAISSDEWLDVARSFDSLLKRGARTYLIYSADDEGFDHLAAQVGTRMARLRRNGRFRLDLVEGADHTFSQLWAQAHLRELVATFLVRHFSPTPGPKLSEVPPSSKRG